MTIQLILTFLGLVAVSIGVAQIGRFGLAATALVCSGTAGVLLVWNPTWATAIANSIGVGRGADLLLYLWVIASGAFLLLLFAQQRRQMAVITVLARHVAISEARPPWRQIRGADPKS